MVDSIAGPVHGVRHILRDGDEMGITSEGGCDRSSERPF